MRADHHARGVSGRSAASSELHGGGGPLQFRKALFQFLGLDRLDAHLDRVNEHLGHVEVDHAVGDAFGDPFDRNAAVGWGAQLREFDADGPGFPRRVGGAPTGALKNESCSWDVAFECQARQSADDRGGVVWTDCVF